MFNILIFISALLINNVPLQKNQGYYSYNPDFSSKYDPEECYSFGKAFTDDSSFVNYLSRFTKPIVVREDFHIPQQ